MRTLRLLKLLTLTTLTIPFIACKSHSIVNSPLLPPKDLPPQTTLPNPLRMDDGSPITTPAQWQTRRAEIKRIVEYYFVGRMPPAPGNVKGETRESLTLSDGTQWRSIHLTFGPDQKLGIDVSIYTPAGEGPFATFVWPIFSQNPRPALTPATQPLRANLAQEESIRQEILHRGYALVTYQYTQSAPDTPSSHTSPFFAAYPNYDWGNLGVYAWTMSRCVDYFQTQKWADKSRIIATGHSRLGKTALIAGAFDDRFALVAPAAAGAAGTGLFRVNGNARTGKEGLEEYTAKFSYQVSPRLVEFSGHVDTLPFDQHWLMALVAPRPLIALDGTNDTVCNGKALKAGIEAARPTYAFLKAPDALGVNFLPHTHSYTLGDWQALLDFTDAHLRGKPVARRFDTFPSDELLK